MLEVAFAPADSGRLRSVLAGDDRRRHDQALRRYAGILGGRRLWHVNSTATGGGVAEMLTSLVPYTAEAGVAVGWLVVEGDDDFFVTTKRIHNWLHDNEGDGGSLGDGAARQYRDGLGPDLDQLADIVRPGDVVILHDAQTAGLAPALREHGAVVVWRCHVGVDRPGRLSRLAWDFLREDVLAAHALVFSRDAFVWDGLEAARVAVIPPCIDVLSPKNEPMEPGQVLSILDHARVIPSADRADAEPSYTRRDGTVALVGSRAEMIEDGPVPADACVVAQVSRWDRLKDPRGVMDGFAATRDLVADGTHLILAGPATDGVADDPEGDATFAEVRKAWKELPAAARPNVHIAGLPMDDDQENGAIVNALQRRADVVVQKSLAEGFGLTVAEAMWKDRVVVASAVGGIQDQIVHGESGVLLDDPSDRAAYGRALAAVISDPSGRRRMGAAARRRVCDHFLPLHHFEHEADLLARILE